MANSRVGGAAGTHRATRPLQGVLPANTPGPRGRNDAHDPTNGGRVGDSPGPVGRNDHGDPLARSVARDVPRFPPGQRSEVLRKAAEFLLRWERYEEHPYWPKGESGVTLGVGWDAGQHSEQQLRATWSALDSDDLDELATTAGKKGQDAKSLLDSVRDIEIPRDTAMAVFSQEVRLYYQQACALFPGMTQLPTGAQVALTSLVYNRGAVLGDSAAILDRYWEMRRIKQAVAIRDLMWIYDELGYMVRVWRGTDNEDGLRRRRQAEQKLILPYVKEDLELIEMAKQEGFPYPDLRY